ncbi:MULTISPECIES: hypothetical protein [unclassified Amycolatopsis]|nr:MULTISPECIES: hypothetical protein [unclassified Amycolatopsis]
MTSVLGPIDEDRHPGLVVVRLRGQHQVDRRLRGLVSALLGGC